MRKLAYLTLIALVAAACKKTPPTCDTSTTTTTTHSVSAATSSWGMSVDDDDTGPAAARTVCSGYSWDLTGQEYTSSDCPDCDYAFEFTGVTAGSGNGADAGPGGTCPTETPFPYSFPYSTGSYYTGFGYLADGGTLNGILAYGLPAFTGTVSGASFFTFLDYNGTIYYPEFHTGSVTWTYGGTASNPAYTFGPYNYGGTFTDSSGDISWNNPAESFHSGTFADLHVCQGVSIRNDDPPSVNPNNQPSDPMTAAVDTPDQIADGTLTDCTTSMSDVYTVTVPAGDTIQVSVDELTTTSTNAFDSKVWVVNSDGCWVSEGDDQFNCQSGQCPALSSSGSPYNCCSATKATNSTGSNATFKILVASTRAYCKASPSSGQPGEGDYELAVKDQTNPGSLNDLTLLHDNYYPKITSSFSGSATVDTQTHTTVTNLNTPAGCVPAGAAQ